MAIRFEDKAEAEADGPRGKRGKPAGKAAAPEAPPREDTSDNGTLPFAKPVKAEKKRRGR